MIMSVVFVAQIDTFGSLSDGGKIRDMLRIQ